MTLTDWQARLEAQRAQLLSDLNNGAAASAPVELDQTRIGRVSRMDALQQQAMSKAADQRRRLELRQIEAALGRIQDGSFGYCAQCEEPIEDNRLAFSPANPLCLKCAEARE